MGNMTQQNIAELYAQMQKTSFNKTCINFIGLTKWPEKLIAGIQTINRLFTYTLLNKRPDVYAIYTPFNVTLHKLKNKSRWTAGDYVAVEHPNGDIDLHLNPKTMAQLNETKIFKLVWVLMHELRHTMQARNPVIGSLVNHANYSNFLNYMKTKCIANDDTIDHVLHELKPKEIDAHAFACEITGLHFTGTSFNINDETLKLLDTKTDNKCLKNPQKKP